MTRYIQRYSDKERTNHWAVAILFVMAALSGLAFFHPSLYFLSNLFGGGAWTRILHPFIGVVMFVLFVFMFLRYKDENKMTPGDKEWLKHQGELLRGDKSNMPPAGKYNAAQKQVFWVMVGSFVVLLLTGIIFWRPWFADFFPVFMVRAAVVLHAIAGVLVVLTVIIHVYAAIWIKGSIRAMTRGDVTEAWAKQNHALWHQEMTERK